MKKILLILYFFALVTISKAQDFDKNLASARTAYSAGKLEDARFAMDQMLRDLDIAIGKEIMKMLHEFPATIEEAANNYDPSLLANFSYALAKNFNRFWHEVDILRAENEAARDFRLKLSLAVGTVLKSGMDLIGIEMPDKM